MTGREAGRRVPNVAGVGRLVRREEGGIQILAPVTCTMTRPSNERTAESKTGRGSCGGFKVEHVCNIAQTDGGPVPEVRPVLVEGDGRRGSEISSPRRWRPPAIR
jgi:hypothetical protein